MESEIDDELKDMMLQDYSYPPHNDPDIQEKLYKKLEFNTYKIPERPVFENYDGVEKYRNNVCGRSFALAEHQQMLSNFINPNTPYKGIIIYHGLGTGKTCVAIAIAEKFKELVTKYGTKIHVLVPGPILKENWRSEIVKCTGNTYMDYTDKNVLLTEHDKARINKDALSRALQYYRLMSYRSFYRKVLGEKIIDAPIDGKTKKKTYRKTETGEYERDLSADRIINLDNSLLIVDEAHNLTGNAYGDAVKLIIKNSTNLKIVLLSATPMKNLADDIVFLVNLLRPENDKIDRDKVFTVHQNHEMEFKENGREYLRNMVRGYVSHLRGGDPMVFAKRVDNGIIPKSLSFTKIIPCKMLQFQRSVYDDALRMIDDALDRRSEAVSNFVFPGLTEDNKNIVGYYGKEGMVSVRNQLRTNKHLINTKLSEMLGTKDTNLIYVGKDGKSIVGNFLHIDNLKHFSTKFYTALKNVNKLVWGKKGAQTAFIYSNLVKVGIDLFKLVLLQNGYCEYDEHIQTSENTRCYFCGIQKSLHSGKLYVKTKKTTLEIPEHHFKPATFMVITGKSSEEAIDNIPEESKQAIDNVFNHIDNIDGKNVKFILGSKVINEGISMSNVGEVHILDVYFNFGRVDQVVGRAIRRCSHYKTMSRDNPYPEVHVHKYAIVLENDTPSTEELLYQKAEKKHLLIKKVERIMKEEAIDCALNMSGNVFKEDIDEYANCGKEGQVKCPAVCDYADCNYKCSNKPLNEEFYDVNNKRYTQPANIDKTTLSYVLLRAEIDYAKAKIKELFLINYVYTLDTITNHIRTFYKNERKTLFDEYYVYSALNELIPVSENDFNNFRDVVVDKYGRKGYIIYVNKFYIYQPFGQTESTPMYYRTNYDKDIKSSISLFNYLKRSGTFAKFKSMTDDKQNEKEQGYDFDSVADYYLNRKEFDIVGIIDKEPNKKKLKNFDELLDVFKIREKRKVLSDKKRGTGIQTLTGSVCSNSQSREYLEKLLKKLSINISTESRSDMCHGIMEKLLLLEKYGTDSDKNKMTYMIIPANHPLYPFPYNLEDRTKHIIDTINATIKSTLQIHVTKRTENKLPFYNIVIKHTPILDEHRDFLKTLQAEKNQSEWKIVIR